MPDSVLFEPITIGALVLANRIAVEPACQYSAEDGCMSDWHLIQLGQLALSGVGLLTIEATAVLPEGRTSLADVGLWNAETQAAMSLTMESIRRWSDTPVALTLSHAGRKGAVEVPWRGGAQLPLNQGRGWQTRAPSAVAFGTGEISPQALDHLDMKRIREAFSRAATRASRVGLDAVQVQAAQGYLLHQFLSPISNLRGDQYGGRLENRMRFPLEVVAAVRDAWPAERPVLARIPVSDCATGGWDFEQALEFATGLVARGCDAVHVSSGGLLPVPAESSWPEDLIAMSSVVRKATSTATMVTSPVPQYAQVEAIVSDGHADLVSLTSTVLCDPGWPRRAAHALGGSIPLPARYRDAG